MNVKIIRRISFEELKEQLRGVPLKKEREDGSKIYPYKTARIVLGEFYSDDVNPTSFYLIRENLERQERLRDALIAMYSVDTLKLDEALEIKTENGQVMLTPPILELAERVVRYQAQDGEICYAQSERIKIPLINDGLHRVYLARQRNLPFRGVMISGIPSEHPFYAHPHDWSRVQVMDAVPKTKEEKKLYLREDCYALYRDFGVFGVGKPRGTKSETPKPV